MMEVGEVRIINGRVSLIVAGQGGNCNYWCWKTIRKDGTLGEEYGGYNNGEHKISKPVKHKKIIQVDLFDLLKVKE